MYTKNFFGILPKFAKKRSIEQKDFHVFALGILHINMTSHIYKQIKAQALYIIRNLLRYIVRTKARVYLAFCEYIIKPQGKYTLARDEIQGRRAALDDIRRTSRVDDMPSLRLG